MLNTIKIIIYKYKVYERAKHFQHFSKKKKTFIVLLERVTKMFKYSQRKFYEYIIEKLIYLTLKYTHLQLF